MKTEDLIYIYPFFLSFLILGVIGKLSEYGFGKSERSEMSIRFVLKRFIKSYIRDMQYKKQSIGNIFKYIFFLSSSFMVLQLQLAYLALNRVDIFPIVFFCMVLYVIFKYFYLCSTKIENEDYISFIKILDALFIDLFLIIMFFFLEKNIDNKVVWCFAGALFSP
ncbi:MAG: hypothetical protein OXB88_08240, partial [Bacteriovoracales bacterium]|nr:hypothetical protein [Bacteriovoracales bacterium]